MKKVLWLPSWYPTKVDPFRGDFIQRHAQAVSAYHEVHVIFVEKKLGTPKQDPEYERTVSGNLTEEIIYNPYSSLFVFGKLVSLINYYRLSRYYIKKYIDTNGLPGLVHVHVPIKAGIIALWIKWKYKVPYLLTEHYGIYNDSSPLPYKKRSFLFRYFVKKIIKHADGFLPVSDKIAKDIASQVVKRNYTVIWNTVNTQYFYYKPPPAGNFIFLHPSNMVELKNVEGIIRAFQQLWLIRQNVELWLAGPAPEKLMQYVHSSPLYDKAIFLKGEVPYHTVAEQMQQTHCVLLFSRTENMPCVLLEAMCSGRPVIATRVGGIPEVVTAENGILINSEDESALTEAMNSIINNYDQYKLTDIEKEAKALYSYGAVGKKIAGIYDGV